MTGYRFILFTLFKSLSVFSRSIVVGRNERGKKDKHYKQQQNVEHFKNFFFLLNCNTNRVYGMFC